MSKSANGFSLNGDVERYQNFLSTTPGQVITITHAPSFDSSSVDQPLRHTPFYWSFDASAAGLSRSEPAECTTSSLIQACTPPFSTGTLLGRFDLSPQISLPLLLDGWSLRPELTLHETYYTQRLVAARGGNPALGSGIRSIAMRWRPEWRFLHLRSNVFSTNSFWGESGSMSSSRKVAYRFVTGVNNFAETLKFDERDILTDTHEVEYGFVTRLYARQTSGKPQDCEALMSGLRVGGPSPESLVPWQHSSTLNNSRCPEGPSVREIVTWELAQKYFLDPTFGGALIAGQRNMFTTTADLTGIAFVSEPRHLSPLISRLRVETSARTDAEWDMDYDFQDNRVNASTVLANYHVGAVTIGGGDAVLNIPVQAASSSTGLVAPASFNQFRAALGYGSANKRGFSAASSFGFDAESKLLQFVSALRLPIIGIVAA